MDIEKRITELLGKMSVKEKIGQLNQISSPLKPDEEIFKKIRRGEIGSFLMATTALAGNDDSDSANEDLINEMQRVAVEESPNGIPIIFGRDVIHGHNTVFPIPLAMAASFNTELIEKCYRDTAKEAARDGVQWSFTPMLDVSRDPRWGRCVEGPGEDPFLGSELAKAVVKGFQGDDLSRPENLVACAKHYIGYGASEGGRDYHHTEITDNSLRNYYLKAFRSAVDSGVQTVMNSFNEIGGQPTVSSHYLLTEILRDELGFDGFVVADYNAVIQQIAEGTAYDEKDASEKALSAGIDMDMVDECYINTLESSIENGDISTEILDEAVRRILRVKLRAGLFDNPYIPKIKIDKSAHAEDARNLAGESVVLLKNNNNILPLSKNAKLAFIGPMIREKATQLGSWSLDGKPLDVVSIIDGSNSKIEGGRIFCTDNGLHDEQIMNIKNSEIAVIAIGESRRITGEYNSVANIEVAEEYVDIARRAKSAGKPVVAVLCYGRPVALKKLEPYCDAILYCWHLGTQAGNAIADVLFGDVNPSGKLPMTLPLCTGQIPIYYNAPRSTHDVNGYYGQGYSYRDCDCKPMYPFGFGLSFTTFKISDLKVSCNEIALEELKDGGNLKVLVTVQNTGNYDGKEVIQMYICDKVATFARPIRELKGYKKIPLKKGEAQNVTFEIGFEELSFYIGKEILVEKGEFEVYIGNNCYADNVVNIKVV